MYREREGSEYYRERIARHRMDSTHQASCGSGTASFACTDLISLVVVVAAERGGAERVCMLVLSATYGNLTQAKAKAKAKTKPGFCCYYA